MRKGQSSQAILRRGDDESTLPSPEEHVCSSVEIPKCHVKQGPMKSSKKFKVAEPIGDNE